MLNFSVIVFNFIVHYTTLLTVKIFLFDSVMESKVKWHQIMLYKNDYKKTNDEQMNLVFLNVKKVIK